MQVESCFFLYCSWLETIKVGRDREAEQEECLEATRSRFQIAKWDKTKARIRSTPYRSRKNGTHSATAEHRTFVKEVYTTAYDRAVGNQARKGPHSRPMRTPVGCRLGKRYLCRGIANGGAFVGTKCCAARIARRSAGSVISPDHRRPAHPHQIVPSLACLKSRFGST